MIHNSSPGIQKMGGGYDRTQEYRYIIRPGFEEYKILLQQNELL